MSGTQRSKAHPDLVGFDPARDLVLGPGQLKGLAHPLRLRLRDELAAHGPATASQLAVRVGESSGATSYHLRQLAAHGLVADAPALGHGRERYWRALHRSIWFQPYGQAAEPAAQGEYVRAAAQLYAERIVRFAGGMEAAAEGDGAAWAHAWQMSDWVLDLTPEGAQELARRFHELCAPHRHDAGRLRPGTEAVVVQFQVLPARPDPGPA